MPWNDKKSFVPATPAIGQKMTICTGHTPSEGDYHSSQKWDQWICTTEA